MKNLSVIKIGGSTIEEWKSSIIFLKSIKDKGIPIIIVHGGGKTVSEWSSKLGIRPEFVKGLRKTDSETLEVACSILAGLINSRLVSNLENLGITAVGLCGVSSKVLVSSPIDDNLGLVGEISKVNPELLIMLLENGYTPVISPLAFNSEAKDFNSEGILNINADFVAAKIAYDLYASKIIYQTDVDGILDHNGRIVPRMTLRQAKDLLNSGVIGGGMIPKLESCISALDRVDHGHIINGYGDSLLKLFEGQEIGTQIFS